MSSEKHSPLGKIQKLTDELRAAATLINRLYVDIDRKDGHYVALRDSVIEICELCTVTVQRVTIDPCKYHIPKEAKTMLEALSEAAGRLGRRLQDQKLDEEEPLI